MSLHDVVIDLLHGGFPKDEAKRDQLIAAVEDDRSTQAEKDRVRVVANMTPEERAAALQAEQAAAERTRQIAAKRAELAALEAEP